MSEERDLEAVAKEFLPDGAQMEREIEEEWKRMHERGETIRVGDASENVRWRWMMRYGLAFFGALRSKGWLADDEAGADSDEDEPR
jgi:hypothetical protein